MDKILELDTVYFKIGNKKKNFAIKDASFSIPRGCVMGLIGENGAGKTTLIRLILSMYLHSRGDIFLFGEAASRENINVLDKIGFFLNTQDLYNFYSANKLGKFLSHIYSQWDNSLYEKYLQAFRINPKAAPQNMSAGDLVKVQLAAALCHHAQFLILDEPMNSLDPVARHILLDMLRDFMRSPDNSVLISSHLTNDLEKICDAITYMRKGQILFSEYMDTISDNWGILKIDEHSFQDLNKADYISFKKTPYAYEVLTNKKTLAQFDGMVCSNASLEDIMYFYCTENEV